MKKNRRNNSRPAAIATAKDTTKAIETRAGVLKEAEDVKKEAKTSFYLQYMGKEISTEEITKKVHEVWTKEYGKSVEEIKTLNDNLKLGIFAALIFPVLMIMGIKMIGSLQKYD